MKNTMPIELKSLEITKIPSYSTTNANQYVAKVEYTTGASETSLLLTPEVTRDILQFLGPVIVQHTHNAAVLVAESMQASLDALTHTRQVKDAPKAGEAPIDVAQATT